MKLVLWSLLALFLIGDAFFVLPIHLSGDTITSHYYINYKKDSLLLKNVFPDRPIRLKLNMPSGYESLYGANSKKENDSSAELLVNVSVFHNLDFTAVSFPFYKLTTFNGVIPFYSIIKASNEPDRDSTALVGNIVINGKVNVKGICTPLYARTLVEKNLVNILKTEIGKIETDINRPPDTSQIQPIIPEPIPETAPVTKPVKRKRR
jgi:hypothetical protein